MIRIVQMLTLAALVAAGFPASIAKAAEGDTPPKLRWSFGSPVGKFDRAQLQRGLRVYREVCQACHSLSLVSFRNLYERGGPEMPRAQVQALAREYKVKDGPNDQGEMFEREGRLADRFPSPFANDAAARLANGGVLPPDLSVMAKARTYERGFPLFLLDMVTGYQEHGADYLVALLRGYEDAPAGFKLPQGTHYNKYFPGRAISMPKPLNDGQVAYTDDAPQTLEQYSKDVAAFLMWTAEPHLEARKRLGLQVMIFLIVLAGLLYFVKKRVWKQIDSQGRPKPGSDLPGGAKRSAAEATGGVAGGR